MWKRKYDQLAIYENKNNVETVPLSIIQELIGQKGTDTVYITRDGKLDGIICLKEVLNTRGKDVTVNKKYSFVEEFDVIKAHRLFEENQHIHKIPVVDEQGKLLMDYDRWEDQIFIERNQSYYMSKNIAKKILETYKHIYVVEPSSQENNFYLDLLGYLDNFEIKYSIKTKCEIQLSSSKNELCILMDHDELRAMQCLTGICLQSGETLSKRMQCITYCDLLHMVIKADGLGHIPEDIHKKVNEKASILLTEMKKYGVESICINGEECTATEYLIKTRAQLLKRLESQQPKASSAINESSKKVINLPSDCHLGSDFWCELYQLEDYKNGIAQKELAEAFCDYRRKDVVGKYCNSKDGKRVTLYQPKEYIGTIYFLGPCTFFGYYSEDKYTIESCLQKTLLESGYLYRVENYASPVAGLDSEIDNRLLEIDRFSTNDIIVYMSRCGSVEGIKNYNLWDICEQRNIPSEWMLDGPLHINYKANKLVSDSIYTILESSFLKRSDICVNKTVPIDLHDIMKKYVQHKYLDQYFGNFASDQYGTIGAIVMNCNPFTKGHLYLIEWACRQVDFLIVFVVQENISLFSFEERHQMVQEGTKELDNVMVVPSGELILSSNNFWEYFVKLETGVTDLSAEYDINFFAEYIAAPLHITHRFAGEEPIDRITSVYNSVMKKILPQRGIEFIEVPRIFMNGDVISASKVRSYMESGEYEKAFQLLPETTISFMCG